MLYELVASKRQMWMRKEVRPGDVLDGEVEPHKIRHLIDSRHVEFRPVAASDVVNAPVKKRGRRQKAVA